MFCTGGFVRNPTPQMPRVGGTCVLTVANDRDNRARERQQLGRYTDAVERFLLFLASERLPYPRTF
eukprot:3681894-Amphidinium_carterae.3